MQIMIKQMRKSAEFYALSQDNSINRWLVEDPDITDGDDTWFNLKLGKPILDRTSSRIIILTPGPEMDVNFTAFCNLVLSCRAATLLAELAPGEAQYLDASIHGGHARFKVVNILNHLNCLDESLSDMLDPFPDGRINLLTVAVRGDATRGRNVFRIANWPSAVVVTKLVRDAFMAHGFTGGVFTPLLSS